MALGRLFGSYINWLCGRRLDIYSRFLRPDHEPAIPSVLAAQLDFAVTSGLDAILVVHLGAGRDNPSNRLSS